MAKKSPLVALLILDGYGLSLMEDGNAIKRAKTPVMDALVRQYPYTTLDASGVAVGLPWGEPGNSEVGHTNLGAGQVIYQPLPRINLAIEDKSIFENEALLKAVEQAKKNGGKVHLVGLCSNGGVHGHIDHLKVLIDFFRDNKIKKNLFIHMITDGRDTPPNVGINFFEEIKKATKRFKYAQIASVLGRYYAMDRNNNWDRTEKAYVAMLGKSELRHRDPAAAIKEAYDKGQDDESLECVTIVDRKDNPIGAVEPNDVVLFFNFRPDRARQLTKAFVDTHFKGFDRGAQLPLMFVTMMKYEEGLPVELVFPPQNIKQPVGKIIAAQGISQLRIAETEKYAHVTYFFNGGNEEQYKGEDRLLVPSPNVKTYDLKPEMSASTVTSEAVKYVKSEKYGFIVLNYANPDMVGHTGNFKAGVTAVETIDYELGKTLDAIKQVGGTAVVVADHGNAETMKDPVTGGINKEHTANPVSMILVNEQRKMEKSEQVVNQIVNEISPVGILADVGPTLLDLMDLSTSSEMTGRSLVDDMY